MSDTLLLTKERREEREGGSLLIEFPDNVEINLTPAKFDYSSGAVLSCSPVVKCVFLLSLSLSVSAVAGERY